MSAVFSDIAYEIEVDTSDFVLNTTTYGDFADRISETLEAYFGVTFPVKELKKRNGMPVMVVVFPNTDGTFGEEKGVGLILNGYYDSDETGTNDPLTRSTYTVLPCFGTFNKGYATLRRPCPSTMYGDSENKSGGSYDIHNYTSDGYWKLVQTTETGGNFVVRIDASFLSTKKIYTFTWSYRQRNEFDPDPKTGEDTHLKRNHYIKQPGGFVVNVKDVRDNQYKDIVVMPRVGDKGAVYYCDYHIGTSEVYYPIGMDAIDNGCVGLYPFQIGTYTSDKLFLVYSYSNVSIQEYCAFQNMKKTNDIYDSELYVDNKRYYALLSTCWDNSPNYRQYHVVVMIRAK